MAERDDASRDRAERPVAAPQLSIGRMKSAEQAAGAVAESPERELERIAERIVDLRRQGRDEEADRALAEFRKRHPDYRIPDEMLLRLERR